MGKNPQLFSIEIENYTFPVKLYKEWRKSVRYSIAKKSVILRLPKLFSASMVRFELARLENWLIKQLKERPKIATRFKNLNYFNGQILNYQDKTYHLIISHQDRKTISSKIEHHNIIIKVPSEFETKSNGLILQEAIRKAFVRQYKSQVVARVHKLNDQHFKERIESVRMKNNQSNWGSCSSKRNINLSSRLLLAPSKVLDYVIIHELAHLKEMNHSNRFWKIVQNAMPDYKVYEDWLKKYGHSLNF